ncbi:MAG: iron complex outerrane recepter protein [Acidobacteriota bacterium]|jgi:outer membrane receptor protein involved in Fe transport|nr:iron complex outerrane recepter protein [Acidobacteriota bacterium]
MPFLKLVRGLAGPAAFAIALPAFAQANPPQAQVPTVTQTIEVTATRTPEDVESVPASITIVRGEELEAHGVTDLPSALALAAGISVAPGGDVGPAGSVPEIWGLREFDAFLLVVDGVPWGGAFNPALPSLNLTNVERIEILRGAAPVMYGATSFVGVIHVIHRAAGAPGRYGSLAGGSYGSYGAAISSPLPGSDTFQQSLSVDGEKRGFKDDRTNFDRGHVLYRSTLKAGGGSFRFDLDGAIVNQDPASPHVREGRSLSPLNPLDANYNPRDAKLDEDRLHFVTGYDRDLPGMAGGSWSTTLALTHSKRDTVRGFLLELSNTDPNAEGFTQDLKTDDAYFDTHVAWRLGTSARLVAGFDHLYGKAKADSETFDYFVPLSGHGAPSSADQPRDHGFDLKDTRNFSGLYVQTEWDATARFHVLAGARLNHTVEKITAGDRELSFPDPGDEGTDERTVTRASGVIGVNWLAWGESDRGLWLFADYRDTFKPAALDFGPEAEPDILQPERAKSWEAGLKNRLGRFEWELTGFQMDFENLVIASTNEEGLPELINGGKQRFKGVELEARVTLATDLTAQGSYAWHDAKFRDFEQEFDGVPTQLAGNRLEMSARNLGSLGLIYAPAEGFNGFVLANYVGERFLNKRNTALAPSYTAWSAGIGYRYESWEARLTGENLGDTRPPVAESELGDAQYYRLPARSLRLSLGFRF